MANEKPQQKAIKTKEQENEIKEDILSGIIDDEKRTYTFEKTYEMYGKKLRGTFEAKYMSITDRMKIGVIRARLLDGITDRQLDPITSDISFMIAYLQVALIKAPKWWNYEQMSLEDDMNKLREVYKEVLQFNKSFRRINEQNADAGYSTDTSGEEIVEGQ